MLGLKSNHVSKRRPCHCKLDPLPDAALVLRGGGVGVGWGGGLEGIGGGGCGGMGDGTLRIVLLNKYEAQPIFHNKIF